MVVVTKYHLPISFIHKCLESLWSFSQFLNSWDILLIFTSSTFFTSCTVCGKFLLQVSGSFITNKAEINIGIPIITIGNGDQILAKGPKYGTIRLKTLEIVEAEPTAWERKFVGYNSLVIK